MLKTLVNLFGWVPVLGLSLKMAFISQKALEVVNGIKVDPNKAQLHGEELEKHISELSKNAYEEHLKPVVDELDLPEYATNKASEKAIEILSKKLKEKYTSKVG